ncbi:MAG: hypothetical protein WC717_00780 [Candidatus Micrarchaeia archaeon]|jgi:MFS family permease
MCDASLNQSIQNLGFILGFALGAWLWLKIANLIDYIFAIFGENMTKPLSIERVREKRDYFLNRAALSIGLGIGLIGLAFSASSRVSDLLMALSIIAGALIGFFLVLSGFLSAEKYQKYHEKLARMNGEKIDDCWKLRELFGLE